VSKEIQIQNNEARRIISVSNAFELACKDASIWGRDKHENEDEIGKLRDVQENLIFVLGNLTEVLYEKKILTKDNLSEIFRTLRWEIL